jgi:hypothetical protein
MICSALGPTETPVTAFTSWPLMSGKARLSAVLTMNSSAAAATTAR